uniref:Uncharacterized protein n=1 Tax=Anguilla anguilla TaxID=7936 RepID=A0A0E9T5I2_ANGAN
MCLPQDLWVIEVIERLFIYFKKELNWSFEVLTILSSKSNLILGQHSRTTYP